MSMKDLPFLSFVVIGAMKAGTTSLYSYLAKHPELSLPYTEKEVNFFNNEKHWDMGANWYVENFRENDLKRGEVNPNYAMFPRCQVVPERLYQFSPNIKIIYILRDPIERLRSHIHHNYIKGLEDRSIEEILSDQSDSLWYISYSKYFYQLEKYLKFFSKEQIFITTLEDLSSDPIATMNSIFEFLDIKKNLLPEACFRKNHDSNEKVKAGKMLELLRKTPLIKIYQSLKPILPINVHIGTKRLLGKHFEKPILNESQILYLKNIFHDDVVNLKKTMGNNFDHWKYNYTDLAPTNN